MVGNKLEGHILPVQIEGTCHKRFFSVECDSTSSCRNCIHTVDRLRKKRTKSEQKLELQVREYKGKNTIKNKKIKTLEETSEKLQKELDELTKISTEPQDELLQLIKLAIRKGTFLHHQYLFRYLLCIFKNLATKNNVHGMRWDSDIILWALNIRFAGGTSVFDVIRGGKPNTSLLISKMLDNINLPLPSLDTIRSYIPEYSFNTPDINFLASIIEDCRTKNISLECCIAWDEIEINGGLVYSKRTKSVIGWVGDLSQV